MLIDFIAYQPDSYNIYLKDYSPINRNDIPEQIFAMTLDIKSDNITGGQISEPIDLLAYMLSTDRSDANLYNLTSQDLGLGESQIIPDGVYEFTYTVNSYYIKSHKFIVYLQVETKVNELLANVGYSVNIGNYDISYVGDYSQYDIEKVRLAVSLLDELRSYAQVDDETKVKSSLDKLQRLLTLIENELN